MQIRITPREIIDKGLWSKFCEVTHISEWAINEGQMDSDEFFMLTEEQAKEMGLT